MMSSIGPIPLLTPRLPDFAALQPYLAQIDLSGHYSNFGPLVKSLENRLKHLFEAHTEHALHVTTVNSATAGLELTLSSLGLKKGSRVLVPALTFVATLTAVIRAGLIPVVADIDPHSWLLTPEIAQAAIEASGAGAAIVVATFGQPQDSRAWSDFQRKTGVRIIIDAAGAFGNQWLNVEDIPVVYSMHATKSLPAGEGGFVVSGDARQSKLIAQLSNFGINLDHRTDLPVGHLSHVGTNAKLSEYHAAVAHASLDDWPASSARRREIYQAYRQQLESVCGEAIIWQVGSPLAAPTIFSIRVGSNAIRSAIASLCAARAIGTRLWYQPLLHQHSASVTPLESLPCPVAEHVASVLIGLPFSVYLEPAHMQRIADTVKQGINSVT